MHRPKFCCALLVALIAALASCRMAQKSADVLGAGYTAAARGVRSVASILPYVSPPPQGAEQYKEKMAKAVGRDELKGRSEPLGELKTVLRERSHPSNGAPRTFEALKGRMVNEDLVRSRNVMRGTELPPDGSVRALGSLPIPGSKRRVIFQQPVLRALLPAVEVAVAPVVPGN